MMLNFNSKIQFFNLFGVVFDSELLIFKHGNSTIPIENIDKVFIRKKKEIVINLLLLIAFFGLLLSSFMINIHSILEQVLLYGTALSLLVAVFVYKKFKYEFIVNSREDVIIVGVEKRQLAYAKTILKIVSKKMQEQKETYRSPRVALAS